MNRSLVAFGLKSKGAITAEDFNPSIHIKSVHVNWMPGMQFRNLQNDVEWNIVANRRAQSLLLKAIVKGETTVDLSKEDEGEEEAA